MNKIAAIDGDLCLYKIGSIAQKTSVKVVLDGEVTEHEFKNKTLAQEFVDSEGLGQYKVAYEPQVYPNTEAMACRAAEHYVQKIARNAGCGHYQIFIDGEGNFRNEVATIAKYKGNRKQPKPHHYMNIRSHMLKHMGARLVKGIEADDAIAMWQYASFNGKPFIACSTDKDSKGTAGWLYNWDKDQNPKFIDLETSYRNFFKQLLTGDTVDNIKGCRGVSTKSEHIKTIEGLRNPIEMFEYVVGVYTIKAKTKGLQSCYEGGHINIWDEVIENATLLWMIRERKDIDVKYWSPSYHLGMSDSEVSSLKSKCDAETKLLKKSYEELDEATKP